MEASMYNATEGGTNFFLDRNIGPEGGRMLRTQMSVALFQTESVSRSIKHSVDLTNMPKD